jgi:hypothetical protein
VRSDVSFEDALQSLLDMYVRSNWKEAQKHPESFLTLYDACFGVWLAAQKKVTAQRTITTMMYGVMWSELLWAFISALSGAYLPTLRTFRFVFEYSIQSWLLEDKYRRMPEGQPKYNLIFSDPDSRQFKTYFIDRLTFLNKEQVSYLRDLYHRLSEYVHPQTKALENITIESLAGYAFDPEALKLCAEFAREIADVFALILCERFPELHRVDKFRQVAKQLRLRLTLSRLTT